MVTPRALHIVYDADGTVCGEIIYHIRKAFFNGKCSACTITHGPKKEKPEFTQLKGDFNVPVYTLHRDEMHVEARAATKRLPCVLVETELGHYQVLLNSEELDQANGSVEVLERFVRAKLHMKGLTLEDNIETESRRLPYPEDATVPEFVQQ
mmetsp:Transcript_3205/g.9776  ORF Transcript_3205/g.9776 Transcript_3205/m.9776 type:complete len:152 (+) Transcript_3205:92-547(+)|eukprot:CAMPEP_0198727922 /NCGR_PEP_ID=MMETSP1475-20131203/6315_1 /TAXON_ID= ORGANISM="Unidentified sp., Strain CCMP1999" /NCGR_SAMPLE_ID=MMETSP1475 /ASSEMBLY_ACC=CAM_ASM_001111 /LENGTH=151 /DNA_ID=CAMNT_0044490137 /DNA_START=62 /DNA_END=517 /DNA_ORIENTATION=+